MQVRAVDASRRAGSAPTERPGAGSAADTGRDGVSLAEWSSEFEEARTRRAPVVASDAGPHPLGCLAHTPLGELRRASCAASASTSANAAAMADLECLDGAMGFEDVASIDLLRALAADVPRPASPSSSVHDRGVACTPNAPAATSLVSTPTKQLPPFAEAATVAERAEAEARSAPVSPPPQLWQPFSLAPTEAPTMPPTPPRVTSSTQYRPTLTAAGAGLGTRSRSVSPSARGRSVERAGGSALQPAAANRPCPLPEEDAQR